MINYTRTMIGQTYNYRYINEYLQALINKDLDVREINDTSILAINSSNNDLPKMNVPIVLGTEHRANTQGKPIVMLDNNRLRDTDADLRLTLGLLMSAYEDPAIQERFYSVRKLATKAYVNWLGRALTSKFNLPYEDKVEMDIILATYFYCNADTPKKYLGEGTYKGLADLDEITRYGLAKIESVLAKHELADLDITLTMERCIMCIRTISERTEKVITMANVMATVGYSWYGEGSNLFCNLAIEYPPMFITLMYFALIDRSFKRTNLGTVIKEFAVGRETRLGDNFTKQVSTIIKGLSVKSI